MTIETALSRSTPPPPIAIPTTLGVGQDDEWVVAKVDGEWEEVRIHDYARLFEVPGLYEHVVYDALECRSPEVVANALQESLKEAGTSMESLRVLDLGAGNGCVAEALADRGAKHFIGLDICDEAKEAADRDRPDLYERYILDDMTKPSAETQKALRTARPDCVVCVAALGFDDIPSEAFANALDFVVEGGWVAFTIKTDFVAQPNPSGFQRLLKWMVDTGILEVVSRRPYTHRISTDGRPLEYIAYVARKSKPVER